MSSDISVGIVWFRQDLRLADNPAIVEAVKQCDCILPLFIDDPHQESVSQLGAASSVWLHQSLEAFDAALAKKGGNLLLAQGDALDVLKKVIEYSGASRLFWNRCYDPASIKRDKRIKSTLKDLQPQSFNASLIQEPWDTVKADGTPYRVFTPFWRAMARRLDETPSLLKPLAAPRSLSLWQDKNKAKKNTSAKTVSPFVALNAFELEPPRVEGVWHKDMMSSWRVGETAAMSRVKEFNKDAVHFYKEGRDLPAEFGTSRLSPHLHFGEISPSQALYRLLDGRALSALSPNEETYAKEIVWREFAHSLLFYFPNTLKEPLDNRFKKFPWKTKHKKHLLAWQQGMTGVPIVDAGMRELYATGWMHNRVRMIVASYLIKNLLISWREGEAWFRDTLVDADLASNTMGWQWTAGCGADAAPFFRIFNPVLQGEKFDKQGAYVKRWVPEIAEFTEKFDIGKCLHKPWELEESLRSELHYPEPLVDLKLSRQRALDAFTTIKQP